MCFFSGLCSLEGKSSLFIKIPAVNFHSALSQAPSDQVVIWERLAGFCEMLSSASITVGLVALAAARAPLEATEVQSASG